MEASSWGWALGVFLAINDLISLLSSWARAIFELRRERGTTHWGAVAATSLFNAGPWALLATGIFIYYEHAEPWAPWFFGAAGAWIVLLAALLPWILWRNRRRKEKQNAA